MSYKDIAERALKDGQTENITPKYVEFTDVGDIIVGRYLARTQVKSNVSDGVYFQYLFDSDEGLIKFHLGSATDGEAGAVMKSGEIYHIEFLGKEKIGGGKSVNKYQIERIINAGKSQELL